MELWKVTFLPTSLQLPTPPSTADPLRPSCTPRLPHVLIKVLHYHEGVTECQRPSLVFEMKNPTVNSRQAEERPSPTVRRLDCGDSCSTGVCIFNRFKIPHCKAPGRPRRHVWVGLYSVQSKESVVLLQSNSARGSSPQATCRVQSQHCRNCVF